MAEATGNVLNVPGQSQKAATTDDEILASYGGLTQKGLTLLKSSAAAFGTPTTPTAATATTGGFIPLSTTYYYVYTAVSAFGESLPSAQVSQATGAGTSTSTITVTMTAVTGAQGYRVYRSSTTGGPASAPYLFLAAVPGGTLTYVDTGAVTPLAGSLPPTVDTSARAGWKTGTVLKVSGTAKKYMGALQADVGTPELCVGILRKDVDTTGTDKLGNVVLSGRIKGSKIRYSDHYPLTAAELKTLATEFKGRYIAATDMLIF